MEESILRITTYERKYLKESILTIPRYEGKYPVHYQVLETNSCTSTYERKYHVHFRMSRKYPVGFQVHMKAFCALQHMTEGILGRFQI